jgi:hypothetical protein
MGKVDAERELATIRKEIVGLTAENLATHFILTLFFKHLGNADPRMRGFILQAIDDASDYATQSSIARGSDAGHLPDVIRIIEKMRTAVSGKDQPKREV